MVDFDRGAEAMSGWSTAMARLSGKGRPEADRASADPNGAGDLALEVPAQAKPTESALAGFDDWAVRESAPQSI